MTRRDQEEGLHILNRVMLHCANLCDQPATLEVLKVIIRLASEVPEEIKFHLPVSVSMKI